MEKFDLLSHIRSQAFATQKEWVADIRAYGEQADVTYAALKDAKSGRQIDLRASAADTQVAVRDALSWFAYQTWSTSPHRSLEPIVAHVNESIAAAPKP